MKRIKLLSILLVSLTSHSSFAQKYLCKDGKISFFSETPVENIEAKSNECSAAIDSKTGELVFVVPITSFKFEKTLMQEHFNENYMESEKYPKAFFKGKVTEPSAIDYKKDGNYSVSAQGKLTIHNVTRDVSIPGTVSIKNGKAIVDAKFKVRCADYKIKIPKVVMVKIAEEIEVTLSNILSPI